VRHVLDNGLTVILQENHAARVAALQLWVRVGSADEREDEAGLAHLHEHMLFKGTMRRGPGEIARTVESCGGNINAWTSFDQTVYHLALASQFLDEGIDILADAVTESVFDPAELSREIEVVCEEIRRSDDMPARRISRSLFDLAYQRHPYRRPVIGSEESVRSFTRDRILAFYQRHYTTENMVFVAVGDFDERQALSSIERVFANARQKAGERTVTRFVEPAQSSPRVTVASGNLHETHLNVGWHIPGVRSEHVAPLDLLTVLLGQGDASRLTLEVKRERALVNEIYASAYTPQDPGLLIVGASLNADNVAPALKEILRQSFRLRREEFTADELARAKRIVESDTVFQRETVQGIARKLGFFETVAGHIEEEERYLEAVARASSADLREVAERYLRTENLSLALLHPDGRSVPSADALLEEAHTAERTLTPATTVRAPRPYVRLTAASGVAGPRDADGVVSESLPNGIRLLVKEDHTVPLVAFRAAWLGGLRWETPENNGINQLLTRSLLRGTERRSARDLARAIDDLAGSISGLAGRNSYGARGEFLAVDLEAGFELFSDVLLHSAFDPAELAKEKALVLEDIRSRDDNPGSAAFALFNEALYDVHPYRMEAYGSLESVQRLQAEDLRAYSRKNYSTAGLTLAVLGDITPERARALVLEHLGDSSSTLVPQLAVPHDGPLAGPREVVRRLERRQAHLIIGFRGTTLRSPDRAAMDVLCSILSGQGGRLFIELRDKRSMAYSVTAFSTEGLDPGAVGVYIGTAPEKVSEARSALREQLDRICSEAVDETELDRARRQLIGGHELGLQRLSSRAAVIALDEIYGLGAGHHLHYAERIGAVGAGDVLRVARTYLDSERSVTALISPNA
jgi:zinc protease